MLVYEGVKKSFIEDVNLNLIVDKIYGKYKIFFGNTSNSQKNSWKNSMQYMRGVLDDDEIPSNAGIAIEFNIPTTSKRVDFIISGRDNSNKESAIIIELKQWESCNAIEKKDGIVETYVGKGLREVPHPSYQAWSYASLIQSFNENVRDDDINLYPCAFLHNYNISNDDPIVSDLYKKYLVKAPIFGTKDFDKLRTFIKKFIKEGDDCKLLYKIENGKIKPSKMLQDSFALMLAGNKEFCMIDDQKVVFETALLAGFEAVNMNKKTVMIVEGGPGTGKSVLAINLLNEFLQNDMTSFYVSKNSAPRDVYKSKLKISKLSGMNHLFQGSGSFTSSKSNEFSILVVDEAHRLREKSGMFRNLGENQIKEIINAAHFSIFFIDENQKVTTGDIGSIDQIEYFASQYSAHLIKSTLDSQFRCNGSDGYLLWLDNLLGIKTTANYIFDFDYDFKIFESPTEMKNEIFKKNQINNKSRIVAGYCWNWIKDGKSKSDVFDIEIKDDNFKMSWNLSNSSTWAIDTGSINEVGCIHTCQGLEFDYIGVIIGDDLRLENGILITDFSKRARTDQSIKGLKKMYKEDPEYALDVADKIIKNTYRTLMTRGMKGCYIYCTNKNLRDYFKEFLNNNYYVRD